GSGTVGVVNNNGTINPGATGTPGTLSVGNLTLHPGTLALDLASILGYDKIAATGTLIDIAGATLTLTTGTINQGDEFTIISVPGTDPNVQTVTGTFNGLPTSNVSTITVGGRAFTINYTGGDGNDVTLTAGAAPTATLASTVLNGGSGYVNNPSFSQQHS